VEVTVELSKKTYKIDPYKITRKEFRTMRNMTGVEAEEYGNELIAKACGVEVDEIDNLPQPDFHLLLNAFFDALTNPVKADPN
jgi:hypothetical protein